MSDEEYFIDFNTKIEPGKIQAVRVRIDLVTITDMNKPLSINLVDHPLYEELRRYVMANLPHSAERGSL